MYPKVHSRIYKKPKPFLILSQMNPIRTLTILDPSYCCSSMQTKISNVVFSFELYGL
jgi:hypothetical protein